MRVFFTPEPLARIFNELRRSVGKGDVLFSGRAQGPAPTVATILDIGAGPCARLHGLIFELLYAIVANLEEE